MDFILSLPMEVRLVAVFVLGTCLGSIANLGIYRLAWFPRQISPWSWPDPAAPPRRRVGPAADSRLARPAPRGQVARRRLLDSAHAAGVDGRAWPCGLVRWEIGGGLLPPDVPRPFNPDVLIILHLEFAVHVVLITLMLVGSMIDVDETIIPDDITVSGTLIGLLVAAVWPNSLLPDFVLLPDGFIPIHPYA